MKQLKNLLLNERDLVEEQQREIEKLKAQNDYLLEQFRLAQHQRFGKSSEVDSDSGQGELFNEAEQCLEETEAPETESIT